MRADAMRKTNLFGDGTLPAADTRFMAELTLQGTFVEHPEVLFYRRMHSGASSFDRDDDERQQQFWTVKSNGFKLPVLRLNWGYTRFVWQAQISPMDKLRLTLFIAKLSYWRKSEIARELIAYARGN